MNTNLYARAATTRRRARYLPTPLALAIVVTVSACGGETTGTTASGATAPEELTPVSVQMQFLPDPSWGWHLNGIESGIYEEHGIDLELIPGQGSNFTMQQLNENQVQFGQASLVTYLTHRADVGSETMAVFTPIDHPQNGILTTVDADSLDDLVGTTFGVIPFSVTRNILPIMLEQNGLAPDAISIETMTTSVAVLLEGTVDSIEGFLGSNVASNIQIAEDAGVEVKFLDMHEFGLEGYAHSLIVRKDLIESDPDLVGRVVAAMKEAVNASLDLTPEEIAELVTAFAPEVSTETALLEWPDYRELINESGLLDSEVVAANLGYVTDGLGIAHDFQPEDVFTNEFVPSD